MSILVDTNLLIRGLQPGSPQFPAATAATIVLRRRGERLCVTPQVVYELWAVCTRPVGLNGLGLTTQQAAAEQGKTLSLFELLPDTPAIFPEWQRLVLTYDVKGKNAHDARLVAAMAVHGIGRLLTFNAADFARYPGVSVLDPNSSLQTPPSPQP